MSVKKNKISCNSLINSFESPLVVSKSGRVIKPRLHKWEGERISYDVYGNPIAAYSSITREPNNPNCSTKLTTLSYAIGTRLESSKQEYRRSGAYLLPNYVPKLKKKKKKNNDKLVDYSSSETDDSFINIVDQVPLSDEELNNKQIVRYVVEEPPDSDNENKTSRNIALKENSDTKSEQGFYSDPESTSNSHKKSSKKRFLQPHKSFNKKLLNQKCLNGNNWSKDEIERLWYALKATKNLSLFIDWNLIACLISGGSHNGEECKRFAIKNELLIIDEENVYINDNFISKIAKQNYKKPTPNESFVSNVTSDSFSNLSNRRSAALQIMNSSSEKKSRSKIQEKKNVVNYSQSESDDSFLVGIDNITFSDDENNINKYNNKFNTFFAKNNSRLKNQKNDKSFEKKKSDFELTPIPLKRAPHRKIIKSDIRPSHKSEYKKVINDAKNDLKKTTPKRKACSKFKLKEPKKKKNIEIFNHNTKESKLLQNSATKEEKNAEKLAKKKRWTAEETTRLRIALKAAVNPKTDKDWEIIARSISNGLRSGKECKEQAMKIRWNVVNVLNTPNTTLINENLIEIYNNKTKITPKRQSKRRNNNDFFTNKDYNISMLDLDPDDSLLSILKTPTEDAKFARKPFLMKQVLNNTRNSLKSDKTFDETI